MNINLKLQLFTTVPLLIALCTVLYTTRMEFNELSTQLENTYRQNVVNHRLEELKNYVSLARGAVEHLYQGQALEKDVYQAQAKAILTKMRFGSDGYFFAYDFDGVNVVLPGQEWRIGKNWYEMEDLNGVKIVQSIIENSRDGGGYSQYVFNQPSTGETAKKMAYSEQIPEWQWVFGTGVYIDDIDNQVTEIESAVTKHIQSASQTIFLIGVLATVMVFITSHYFRYGEKRLADKKLRELNERIFQTQEEESKRFSRELHDGVGQTLAAAKYSMETIKLKVQHQQDPTKDIEHAVDLTGSVMRDIRSISHQLHPGILEDHGLSAALDEMGQKLSKRSGIKVVVERLAVANLVSKELKLALYRIAQEAMTNVERHAKASEILVTSTLDEDWVTLEITDNGQGFDYHSIQRSNKPSMGIGLRNMKERISFYQGRLEVSSVKGKTSIIAYIPKHQLHYNNGVNSLTD
ncbi:cache domain-containing protein [Thalassotalea montiporae]